MRPIDTLQSDGWKALRESTGVLLINREELKMLKDYGMVEGTPDKDTAVASPRFGAAVTFSVVEVLP